MAARWSERWLFGVVWLPDFYLQSVLRHEPVLWGRPVAVLDPEAGDGCLVEMTPAARRSGVAAGQTPAQALARCGGLDIRTRRRDQEAVLREALLGCAYGRCAFIEDTADGICTMDLSGVGEFLEDPALAGRGLLGQLRGLELRARLGMACTPALALCAARAAAAAREDLCLVADRKAFLRDLPVGALGPDPAASTILGKWGVRTGAELAALGREALAERLGAEGARLWDRAAGREARPLRLARPQEAYCECSELEFELMELEPVLSRLRPMLGKLIMRLDAAHRVAGALRLELGFSDGGWHRADLPAPEPTIKEAALFGLLENHVERLRAAAGIVALRLTAEPLRAAGRQGGLFETGIRDPGRFAETMGRLVGWLGPQRIGYAVLRDSHRPDAFSLNPPAAPPAMERDGGGREERAVGLALRRFRPPQRIDVRTQEGRPAFVRGPDGEGRVSETRGPWRLSGEWWDRGAWSREEWDIAVDGRGLWRVFEEAGAWFVEGVYD